MITHKPAEAATTAATAGRGRRGRRRTDRFGLFSGAEGGDQRPDRSAVAETAEGLRRQPTDEGRLARIYLDKRLLERRAVSEMTRNPRGGRDNDGRFGHRMRGAGHYASLIEKRFALASRRLGFVPGQTLRSDLFRPPHRHGQLPLL